MPARKKTLADLVRDGTFLGRRAHHRELLVESELVPEPTLRKLQVAYRRCEHELEQRRIAKQFEQAVLDLHAQRASVSSDELEAFLRKLGPPGSAEQVINFFPAALQHIEGPLAGRPFELGAFQKRWLKRFEKRDRHKRRVYRVGFFCGPKGTGKTPMGAGRCIYATVSARRRPRVISIAGSREQAGYAHEFAQENADLAPDERDEPSAIAQFLRPGAVLKCPQTGGRYEVKSSDGRLGQGSNPYFGLADELWLFTYPREREAYAALRRALVKQAGESALMVTSTAGWSKESLLGEIYTAVVNDPRTRFLDDGFHILLEDEENGLLFEWWGAPDGVDIEDPKVARRANPAPHIDSDEILRDLHAADADELEIRRLNYNQWTSVREAWFPEKLWTDLEKDTARIPAGADIYVGVDAAQSWDTTAVVIAYRRPSGKVVLQARVWSIRDDVAAHEHIAAATLDNEQLVEPYIHELAKRFRIRELVYDPRYFGTEAQHLAKTVSRVAPLSQGSNNMLEAVNEFEKAVRRGRLVVIDDPNRVFRRHVLSTTVRQVEGGKRIDKIKQDAPIDATTAAVMAHWRAIRKKRRGAAVA